jgi:hypothetical protein
MYTTKISYMHSLRKYFDQTGEAANAECLHRTSLPHHLFLDYARILNAVHEKGYWDDRTLGLGELNYKGLYSAIKRMPARDDEERLGFVCRLAHDLGLTIMPDDFRGKTHSDIDGKPYPAWKRALDKLIRYKLKPQATCSDIPLYAVPTAEAAPNPLAA